MVKLNEEEIGEAICGYSDREIVISVFEMMSLRQARKLLKLLIKDWGER